MCYEQSFFQRWARKKAERRANAEAAVERDSRKQPTQSAHAPATPSERKKTREVERDVEVV